MCDYIHLTSPMGLPYCMPAFLRIDLSYCCDWRQEGRPEARSRDMLDVLLFAGSRQTGGSITSRALPLPDTLW